MLFTNGGKKMTPKDKFLAGAELSSIELLAIPLIDRCRYVTEKFFISHGKSFSAIDVAIKLNELHPDPKAQHYGPLEVYDELKSYYGEGHL